MINQQLIFIKRGAYETLIVKLWKYLFYLQKVWNCL